ncbi:CASP protein 5A1 [Spatholobus suberectus]|nr:CASP protein 5A1 [Spatholobus suberectus]
MSMSMVHPSVHPIEAPPMTDHAIAMPRHTLKDTQGMPGTLGGFLLRLLQFSFALVSLSVMATTSDFPSVTAFRALVVILKASVGFLRSQVRTNDGESGNCSSNKSENCFSCYLIAAVSLQSLWSLTLAVTDIYAILVRRGYQNVRIVRLFSIGDGITSTLTFSAACASAGITVLLGNDLNACAQNHCSRFETATAMAFMSWFAASPSFILNFWTLASK